MMPMIPMLLLIMINREYPAIPAPVDAVVVEDVVVIVVVDVVGGIATITLTQFEIPELPAPLTATIT
jgi:hypothetical protein